MTDTKKIPYLDLSIKDPEFKKALLDAVERVLDHGRFILGPEHDEFENRIAAYCNRRHAVGVGSGTDALFLSLKALGIGIGDEVISTPLTWVATTNAVVLNGATPVFVDIGPNLNIDPGLIEAAITPKTKAILPVHFTGLMCDMEAIQDIADRRNLIVIEDAAQAFGATYKGNRAGSFGNLSCFSINPMKVFNAFGEAGAVTTDDEDLRDTLNSLRYAGTINKEDCHIPSINGRLDTLQAAMLLVNLDRIDDKIATRQKVAEAYGRQLDGIVTCPTVENGHSSHAWYSYTVLAERRDALRDHLTAQGIETKIMHPFLMPYHTAYKGKFQASIPVAEELVEKILCLPNHEEMADDDIHYVTHCIRAFYEG